MNNIRFLRRSEIDLDKWDDTIAKATHSLPYAFSWYLDAVAEHWDALVMDDYKAVMPLVWTENLVSSVYINRIIANNWGCSRHVYLALISKRHC